MNAEHSHVMKDGTPKPYESERYFLDKLRFYTDVGDLALDLAVDHPAIVVVDARGPEAFAAGHIPGAVHLAVAALALDTIRSLDKTRTYVVYSDGMWCQQSTKVAHTLATHGLIVKELMGGFDCWKRAGQPVTQAGE